MTDIALYLTMTAILFVGNLSYMANAQYLERLFSAYGRVTRTEIFEDGQDRYAEVTFAELDDADTAVAALHYRYCTAKNVPLLVLYSRKSPVVSAYGRRVGEEFLNCLEAKRMPNPVPLDYFDNQYMRSSVILPPPDSAVMEPGLDINPPVWRDREQSTTTLATASKRKMEKNGEWISERFYF